MCHRFWARPYYNKTDASYEQQKSYITVFWDGGSYYIAEILLVQSQRNKQKQ